MASALTDTERSQAGDAGDRTGPPLAMDGGRAIRPTLGKKPQDRARWPVLGRPSLYRDDSAPMAITASQRRALTSGNDELPVKTGHD